MTFEQARAICDEASSVAAELGFETSAEQLAQILDEAQELDAE